VGTDKFDNLSNGGREARRGKLVKGKSLPHCPIFLLDSVTEKRFKESRCLERAKFGRESDDKLGQIDQ